MSIVKDYIEKNAELLDNVIANKPELAQSLVEALAILDSFANSNNLVFSDQDKQNILNESYELVNEDAIQEEIKDVEVSNAMIQKEKQLENKVVEYSVLQFLTLYERGDDTPYGSFMHFMSSVKNFTYNGNMNNVPSQGYDKFNISCFWGKKGSVDNVAFEDYRIDVSVSENNPFYSANILLSDYLTSFCYYLRMYFYGIKNIPVFGDIAEKIINRSFFISCLDWQVDREKFRNMLELALVFQMSKGAGGLSKYDPSIQDRKSTYEERMNLLREFLPSDFFQYLFETDNYQVALVVKDDIGINKESNQETLDLFLKTRLTQKLATELQSQTPQPSASPTYVNVVSAPEKEYEMMTTKFESEAKRIIKYADEKGISGSYYFNTDFDVYVILLDKYLDEQFGMSKRTKEIISRQALLGESTIQERYPHSGTPKAKKVITAIPSPSPITHASEQDSKVFLEDIDEEDIKALESIGEIEDEDLTNFNIDDLDI